MHAPLHVESGLFKYLRVVLKSSWVGVTSVVHASDAKVVAHSLGRDVLVVSSAAVVIAIAMFGWHGSHCTVVHRRGGIRTRGGERVLTLTVLDCELKMWWVCDNRLGI